MAVAVEVPARTDGCPGTISVAPPPSDPGGRPDVARHPEPADAAGETPGAVVVGGPCPRIVGDPGPAPVRQHPAAVHVRTPTRRDSRYPDAAVIGNPFPVPVWREALVEDAIVGDIGARRRNVLVFGDGSGGILIRGRRQRFARRWRRRVLHDRRRRFADDFALVQAAAARSRDRESGECDELSWHRHGGISPPSVGQ